MKKHLPIIICCSLLLIACSEQPAPEKPKEKASHIWQGQVNNLKEAKEVGQMVNEQQRLKEERLKNLD